MLPARTISRRRVALVLTLILTGLASGLASDRSEAVGLPPARSVVFGPRPLWAAMVLQASGINPPTATGAEMGAVMNWATARVVKQMVVVPRHTERVPDPGMDKGMTRLVQAGRDGRIERVYLVMRDAAGDASQTLISQRVMTKAQPQVIAVGTREPLRVLLTSRGTYTYRRALTMIATAYEPSERSCGKYADGYTAIGMKAVPGVVAV
ncbi:MAG: G5 domain-containing protein, partial [Firmicutes bacterium]|nr:G5 domain-containing protein [Bacillota bacterium]